MSGRVKARMIEGTRGMQIHRAADTAFDRGGLGRLQHIGPRNELGRQHIERQIAPVMLDSIDSTQLGRFPDADVADSLEHLPGINITRTTGGEGQKISVRGLGPEYNIVTLDNRILASDDDGRDLAFDVLPAELITGIICEKGVVLGPNREKLQALMSTGV